MFRFRKFCPFQEREVPVPPPTEKATGGVAGLCADHDANFRNYDALGMSFLKLERTRIHEGIYPTTRPNSSSRPKRGKTAVKARIGKGFSAKGKLRRRKV